MPVFSFVADLRMAHRSPREICDFCSTWLISVQVTIDIFIPKHLQQ